MSASEAPSRSPLSESEAARLSAYLDGELPPDDLQEVESRLAADPAWKEQLEALRAAAFLVRGAADRATPEAPSKEFAAFKNRLAESTGAELPTAPARPPSRVRQVILSLAGVALLLILLGRLGAAWTHWSGPQSGWLLEAPAHPVPVIRNGRKWMAQEEQELLARDRILLADGERIVLQGPNQWKGTLSGPATLTLESPQALNLEEGFLEISAPAARNLSEVLIRTPDGVIRPQTEGACSFEVRVEAGARR